MIHIYKNKKMMHKFKIFNKHRVVIQKIRFKFDCRYGRLNYGCL